MDGATVQTRARAAAAALPGVSAGYPFTPLLLVYTVAGHVVVERLPSRKRDELRRASPNDGGEADDRHR